MKLPQDGNYTLGDSLRLQAPNPGKVANRSGAALGGMQAISAALVIICRVNNIHMTHSLNLL